MTGTSVNGTKSTQSDMDRLDEMVSNVMSMRGELFKLLIDPRRNVNDECGYPSGPVSPQELQVLHDEDALANRINECLPKETWQVQPSVYESEDRNKRTQFDLSWMNLSTSLRGEKSWYKKEEANPFWENMLRADIQSRIGRYGVIVFGFDDCKAGYGMEQPVQAAPGRKLLSMHALPETLATISSYETNPVHPRYGRPTGYNITFHDPRETYTGIGVATASHMVHWTRVIHVSDGLSSNPDFSQPAVRAVLNEILGSQKVRGGGPEGYWKSAFPTTLFKTIPQLGGNVKVRKQEILDAYEQLQNGLQKAMVLMGMEAQTILGSIVDPTPFINVLIEIICIKLGIPVRIFKGSERGELASSQDDSAWNDRLRLRQSTYVTPRIIVPVVDRLIWAGVLAEPGPEGYTVQWPDLESQSPIEKAQVFATRMSGMAQYVGGGVSELLPPQDMMVMEAGYTDEEAMDILGGAVTQISPEPQQQEPQTDQENPELDLETALNWAIEEDEDGNEFYWCPTHNRFCATGQGGGIDPSCGTEGGGPKPARSAKVGKTTTVATKPEKQRAAALAQNKVKTAIVPTPDKVKKMRAALQQSKDYKVQADKMKQQGATPDQIKAKLGSPPRAGGDARGSAAARRSRAQRLFKEFGGEEKGYVVCHETGIKMHYSSDPVLNPHGYPKFEQGKIFTAYQGGSYTMDNLLPESFEANRKRNNKPVRKENLK